MRKPTYLLVRPKTDHTPGMTSYLVITADAYEVDGDYLANNTIGWLDSPRRYLDHLQIRAQADSSKAEFYGWEMQYADMLSVQQGKAKAMAATLAAMGSKLSKLNEKFGYADSLHAYLARVATVLDCGYKPFLRHPRNAAEMEKVRPGHGEERGDFMGYVRMDAEDLRYWLNGQLSAFTEAYGKVQR